MATSSAWMAGLHQGEGVAARNAEEREHDFEMKNGWVQPSTGLPIGYKVSRAEIFFS